MSASFSQYASLESEALLQPVTNAQHGVTSVLREFIDAHNHTVRQLQEYAQTMEQLRMLDGQFSERLGALSEELRNEIRDAWKAADAKRERDIEQLRTLLEAERDEVREASSTLAMRFTTADEHLTNLDSFFHALSEQLQQQGLQFHKQLREQHESFLERIEGASAGLRESTAHQGTRISKMEHQVSGYQRELDQTGRDRQKVMARLGPLETRVCKTENMCAAAGQEIKKEILQLEAQISAAKRGLCDQLKAVCDDHRKAGQAEAVDVLNKVSNEGWRIGILENIVATQYEEVERSLADILGEHRGLADQIAKHRQELADQIAKERHDLADQIAKERHELADQIAKDFGIAHGDIAEFRAQLQMLEATAHDLQVEMQTSTQRAEQDRELFTTQLSQFDAKHKEMSNSLARCEPLSNQVKGVMRSAPADGEFAAAVTHCLSCGQRRSSYPGTCSSSPMHVDKDAMALGMLPEKIVPTTKQPENCVFRPMPSRPISAGKFGSSEVKNTISPPSGTRSVVAGSAHVACRPRPQSSRRSRKAQTMPAEISMADGAP